MSRVSIHINRDLEPSVIQTLEDAGFEVSTGNGPMVDYKVTGHENNNE